MSGYSTTPLVRKLGLKEGFRVRLENEPDEYFSWLEGLPAISRPDSGPYDFVHLFVNKLDLLETQLEHYRQNIAPDGMIWVSWFKRASKLPSEITEDLIRATCLPLGLVDIKVCSVSDQWSALKLVIRKELR